MDQRNPQKKFGNPGMAEAPQDYPGLESKMVTRPDFGLREYTGSRRLAGKAALITGGDSGIGRAVALAYAREGARVALAYLPEEQPDVDDFLPALADAGMDPVLLPGNLADRDYCGNLVSQARQRLAGLDILVNNAAVQKYFQAIGQITAADFQSIYEVNVIAPFLLSRDAAAVMSPGAAIINTVSVQAYEPSFSLLPYAASKGALVAMTKALAEELADRGIRVNAVAPGPIWSPLNTHGSPPEKLKEFGKNTPLGRPGQPVELAPVYVLLAADEASYITGEIYGVSGGRGIA